MRKMAALCVAFVFVLGSSPAFGGVGVTGRAGTLGIGVEVTHSLVPMLNVRGSFNFFGHTFGITESDIHYDANVKLRSGAVLLDLHPVPALGFRVSAGLVFNRNKLDLTGTPSNSYQIGNQTYTGAQVGQIHGQVKAGATAPYVGIGWGNAAKSRIGIALDLGVAFQGSPQVTLSATGPISSDPTFQTQLKQEEQNVQNQISWFKYYPVISLGVSVKLSAL